MSVICFNCGTKNPDDAQYCARCGQYLYESNGYTQMQSPQNYQKNTYYNQQQPYSQQPYNQSQPYVVQQQMYRTPYVANSEVNTKPPMGWYKFIIYFQLFAAVIVTLGGFIQNRVAMVQFNANRDKIILSISLALIFLSVIGMIGIS